MTLKTVPVLSSLHPLRLASLIHQQPPGSPAPPRMAFPPPDIISLLTSSRGWKRSLCREGLVAFLSLIPACLFFSLFFTLEEKGKEME